MTTSEQARADAMADAETLLREYARHETEDWAPGAEVEAAGMILETALHASHPEVAIGEEWHVAAWAAAAAFRAVPGLREEE